MGFEVGAGAVRPVRRRAARVVGAIVAVLTVGAVLVQPGLAVPVPARTLGEHGRAAGARGAAASAPAAPTRPTARGLVGVARHVTSTRPPVTTSSARVPPGVTAYQVRGRYSGITAQVLVALPPGYAVAGSTRRYPVLETFSGIPGTDQQWVRTMRLPAVLAATARAGRIGPVLVVSPQTQIPLGRDTECVDAAPGRPQLETWLARDVPDWVTAHFRVRTDPSSWATIGLSAGGWCAAMISMLHPTRFGGAVVLAGYFRPLFDPDYRPYPASSPNARRYDLLALARQVPPRVALWVETSRGDPLSYATSSTLLALARPPLTVTPVVPANVGHTMTVWKQLLPAAVAWLPAALSGFAPGRARA